MTKDQGQNINRKPSTPYKKKIKWHKGKVRKGYCVRTLSFESDKS